MALYLWCAHLSTRLQTTVPAGHQAGCRFLPAHMHSTAGESQYRTQTLLLFTLMRCISHCGDHWRSGGSACKVAAAWLTSVTVSGPVLWLCSPLSSCGGSCCGASSMPFLWKKLYISSYHGRLKSIISNRFDLAFVCIEKPIGHFKRTVFIFFLGGLKLRNIMN